MNKQYLQLLGNRISQKISSLPAMLLLSLVLVFTQSAGLIHTHADDLTPQIDCEICLKAGSGEDVVAKAPSLPTDARKSVNSTDFQIQFFPSTTLSFQSRAPPHA